MNTQSFLHFVEEKKNQAWHVRSIWGSVGKKTFERWRSTAVKSLTLGQTTWLTLWLCHTLALGRLLISLSLSFLMDKLGIIMVLKLNWNETWKALHLTSEHSINTTYSFIITILNEPTPLKIRRVDTRIAKLTPSRGSQSFEVTG